MLIGPRSPEGLHNPAGQAVIALCRNTLEITIVINGARLVEAFVVVVSVSNLTVVSSPSLTRFSFTRCIPKVTTVSGWPVFLSRRRARGWFDD